MSHRTCRVLLCALLWAAVPSVFYAQQIPRPPDARQPLAQPAPGGDDAAATFKVSVKLVNVFTTVTDESGAPVSGLTKDDFHVFEDGVEQQIAVFDRESELPLSVVLAVDASLSTRKDGLPLEIGIGQALCA